MEERELILEAITLIRTWHSMGMPKGDAEKSMWDIYYNKSPEMKPFREYLAKKTNKQIIQVEAKVKVQIAEIKKKSETGILVTRHFTAGSVLLRSSADIAWAKIEDVVDILTNSNLSA